MSSHPTFDFHIKIQLIELQYVAELLKDATVDVNKLSLADLHSMRASGTALYPFGDIKVDRTNVTTLAELGSAELRALEETLGRVLQRARGSLGSHSSSA